MTSEKKRPLTAAQIIRRIIERRHPGRGCADGSCIFGHPGGMQTNGGCQCLKEREYPMPQRNIMMLRDVAQVLASMVAEDRVDALKEETEVERLYGWLDAIAVEVNDAHPRMRTLEACRGKFDIIDKQIQAARRGEEAP